MGLAERLAATVPEIKALPLEVVIFSAGGHRCALEAARVRGLRASSAAAVTAEAALGLPESPAQVEPAPRALLYCRASNDLELCLWVGQPVVLSRLDAASVHPLPTLIAARCGLGALRALAADPAGVILLFDARLLIVPDGAVV